MSALTAARPPRRVNVRLRLVAAATAIVVLAFAGAASAWWIGAWNPFGDAQVGAQANGTVLLPTNQWISPYGTRLLDTTERLVASSISPNGEYLAALGWNDFQGNLTIFNLQTHSMVSSTPLVNGSWYGGYDQDTSVGPDGPVWSADGSTLWVPQSAFLLKFAVAGDGTATQTASVALCGAAITDPICDPYNAPYDRTGVTGDDWLPAGIALSPDGSKLYVALNGANTLGVIDTATDQLLQQIPVGNAPRQVVLDGNTAYVSNEGGRPAKPGEYTNMSDGTPIVADDVTGAARTGTVSVVDLSTGQETKEIPVGLEPTALYLDGKALFVANSNDDSMSVIDTDSNSVAQTVSTNPVPGATVGSYANAISMAGPHDLLVSIGRDNAIAVYRYHGLWNPIHLEGLIPTDWYPVGVQPDPVLGAGSIVVTNDKGIGASGPESTIDKSDSGTAPTSPNPGKATGHNTYDDTGSITTFAMPPRWQLGSLTHRVFVDNAWTSIPAINAGAGDTVPSVIPPRIGGHSPIKHIIVIVKENRTYDQVLGDLTDANGQPLGNGDPADAQFGQPITPNQHALAQRFGDLDNFYDEGTLSADGHNWVVQAEANDYVEKEFGAFYRSYPSQAGDALAYQRDGFLWNAAERAGQSVQNFGEYAYLPYSLPSTAGNWDDYYAASQYMEAHNPTSTASWSSLPGNVQPGTSFGTNDVNGQMLTGTASDIPSLEKITDPDFPNFQLGIPDQYRVDTWLPVFSQEVSDHSLPDLSFMWLMTDHTTGAGNPYPVAQVADNDLAVGRVVDAVSHSPYWKSTAIFIVEDDTQNGVDHVDGHRGPVFVVSPYSKPGVDDTYYTQVDMVRTIEQILGVQPMNQDDHSAIPMYDAFTGHPNFAPYDALPNEIPLNCGASGANDPKTCAVPASTALLRREAPGVTKAIGVVPAAMRGVARTWQRWLQTEARLGLFHGQDRVKPALLDRYDWYVTHDWTVTYPGDSKIFTPSTVPGRNIPAAFLGN
jgi:YVTN family beta-propeller protein